MPPPMQWIPKRECGPPIDGTPYVVNGANIYFTTVHMSGDTPDDRILAVVNAIVALERLDWEQFTFHDIRVVRKGGKAGALYCAQPMLENEGGSLIVRGCIFVKLPVLILSMFQQEIYRLQVAGPRTE